MKYDKFYWLNEDSRTFLSRGYLKEGEVAEDRLREISEASESILGEEGFADKFYDYLSRGFYSLSTPVLCNFGKPNNTGVSCFSSYIPDSTDEILRKVGEVGIMSKWGGGTSGYFGDVRPRGSKIVTGGGETDGPIRFMEIFDKVTDVISQSSSRRGSFAAYLPVEHPDIQEFLQIRSDGHPIQRMSIGVTITDDWMESMISGDKQKRSIWGKIIQKKYETGYPYIVYVDTANKNAPQWYKDQGRKILNSNLCVAGNQRVPTQFGLLTAKELFDIGENLQLFDNEKIVNSTPMKLIEREADVYKVSLENGMSHTVTAYHKVKTSFKKSLDSAENIEIKECKDLKIGDRVAIQTKKGLFGQTSMPKEAFLLGLYQADGTQYKDEIHICLWEKDFDLIEEVQLCHDYICDSYNTQYSVNKRKYANPKFSESNTGVSDVRKKTLKGKACKKALNFEKGYIPSWIWESNEETQWQYIRGLFYADGTVNISKHKSDANGDMIYLSLSCVDKEFLKELQILLANLGMQTSIRISSKAGYKSLPDGKGGSKDYFCRDCWRIIIGNKSDALVFDKNTGFLKRKGVIIEDREYRNNKKKYYKIDSIEYVGKEDVYCVTVDSPEHLWVCNGFVTHNCSEIFLPTNEKESFVCVLSCLNLLHWHEIQKTDAPETLLKFLWTVNEEFVRKTKDIPFMEDSRRFAEKHRAIGLGVLGWHSLLQRERIPFESMDAKFLNNKIFKEIKSRMDSTNKELVKLIGECEVTKGYGVALSTTMSLPPTTSSSFILGQVSQSIEPINSNYFVKRLAKGNFTYKNPELIELLNEKNKNDEITWKSILEKGGSVQHLDFLSENEKNVFKTFGEISQKEIIIQAAQRQKYIDQGQSLNITVGPKIPAKEVSELMIEAWRLEIKSLYYQRGSNPSQDLARSLNQCVSCEG